MGRVWFRGIGTGLGLHFQTGMLNMLIQEHVLLDPSLPPTAHCMLCSLYSTVPIF
jgi:hypothetical protein